MRSLFKVAAWLLILGSACIAGPSNRPHAMEAQFPRSLAVTVGDITTRIDGPKRWTLSGIKYQGDVMAVEDSAYGTVLTIRDVGHLGTAHFLEIPGKPGQVEKENVTRLEFFVDEKPLAQLEPSMKVGGKSFRMERTSSIRGLNLMSSVSIRDGVLIETAHFSVAEPIDLVKAHPMMYAWTPEATHYAFGDEKGVQDRGEFTKEGRREKVIKSSRWMAVFNPTSGKGSVWYLLKRPAAAEGWILLIDVAGVYRKGAVYTLVDQVLPVGFEGTFQSAVGFFSATESNWEAEAVKRAAELSSTAAKTK